MTTGVKPSWSNQQIMATVAGDPYRTAGEVQAQSQTPDPLRQWYLDNAGWVYTEFTWDDGMQAAKYVAWEQGETCFTVKADIRDTPATGSRFGSVSSASRSLGSMSQSATRIIDQLTVTAADPAISAFLATRLCPTRVTTKSGAVWNFRDAPGGGRVAVMYLPAQGICHVLARQIEAEIDDLLQDDVLRG